MKNNNYISQVSHLRNSVSYDHDIWYLCKIVLSPGFFSFFVILIFWVVKGVKGQKMVQNDKKILSVVLHISGTIHHMIFIYGTHKENGNILVLFFFHVFKILIFWVVMRVKGQKIVQMTKNSACHRLWHMKNICMPRHKIQRL